MAKIVIYQLLPRLFANYCTTRRHGGSIEENGCGKMNGITDRALEAVRDLGVTHVWYTGVLEHATQTDYSRYGIAADCPALVKGRAGSPYAVKDCFDIDPDLAEDPARRMEEFEALVERTHRAGLKVIIDLVPNHVARQYHSDRKPDGVTDFGEGDNPAWAFSPLNNFYYLPGESLQPSFDLGGYTEYPARATGNDVFHAHPGTNDWYDTVKLNYGVFYTGGGEKQFDPVPGTWHKMLQVVLYWAGKGVDGLRCDMAEMVPVEFWHWLTTQVRQRYPELLFIAEVYQPQLYRSYLREGGFDYLYDKVGLYDTLRNVTSRNHPAEGITGCWQAVDDIQDHMLCFLENHDEQRIASGFYCGDGAYAKPAMIVAATLTRAPVMVYMGQELGETGMNSEGFSGVDGRTSIFDYWSLPSLQAWANQGAFDGQQLTGEQRSLQDFYRRLLRLCGSEKAVSEGSMYDLEYAQNGANFNRHEHFAYFRHHGDETLLVVLNFDDKAADMLINLPAEALAYVGLPEHRRWQLTDLLDPAAAPLERVIASDQPLAVSVEAWTGKVFKLIRS